MGWSDIGDGGVDGDGPADAMAMGLDAVAQEAKRRTGKRPSGATLLHAFVAALNLDGARAPLYAEPRRIAALLVRRRGRRVRIDGASAEAWVVAELHATLDDIAEDYQRTWNRPPRLRELAHYLRLHLDEESTARISDPSAWELADARFVLGKEPKPSERSPLPSPDAPAPVTPRGSVQHPKFGSGLVLREEGDRLTVQFGDDRRVVLRAFLTAVV